MKLEQQVVSLELSKKLKELGVKQESVFYWSEGTHYTTKFCDLVFVGIKPKEFINKGCCGFHEEFSAFTCSELGEMLPTEDERNYTVVTYRGSSGFWFCDLTNFKGDSGLYPKVIREENEADARAKCLIHLIECGMVKP